MGFQLSSLGVEDDLELLRSGAERVGAEGLAIDALALRGRWHLDRERGHGALGVVRAEPEVDVGMDGTSFTAKRNLHTVLRGVGELPGLSGLALEGPFAGSAWQ